MIGEQTRTLDNHINAHFAEIRLLREQRNAACSRTRGLPPEILSKIFGILDYTRNFKSVYCPRLRWMSATHVYRSCRHAAPLNEPTLWTEKVERYELCQRLSRIQHTNHPASFSESESSICSAPRDTTDSGNYLKYRNTFICIETCSATRLEPVLHARPIYQPKSGLPLHRLRALAPASGTRGTSYMALPQNGRRNLRMAADGH